MAELNDFDRIVINAEVFARWSGFCFKDKVLPVFTVAVNKTKGKVELRCYVGKGVDQELVYQLIEDLYESVKNNTFTVMAFKSDPS